MILSLVSHSWESFLNNNHSIKLIKNVTITDTDSSFVYYKFNSEILTSQNYQYSNQSTNLNIACSKVFEVLDKDGNKLSLIKTRRYNKFKHIILT